jgi:hypothetical protein
LTTITTLLTTLHQQKTTPQHLSFPKPHQKTPVKPEKRFDGRL